MDDTNNYHPVCARCWRENPTYMISLPDAGNVGKCTGAMYCEECAKEISLFAKDKFAYSKNPVPFEKQPEHTFTTFYAPYRLTNTKPMDENTRFKYGGQTEVYTKTEVDCTVSELEQRNESLQRENAELRRIMMLATK